MPEDLLVAVRPFSLTKERAAEAFCAFVFLAYILLITLHRQVPYLGDFGDWTYQGVLLRNHIAGIADPAHTLKHYPVPNSLTTVGIGLLALVFSWTAAAKIWLCLYIATALASGRLAIRALQSPWVAWLLLPVIFLGLNFWWGFLNFQFGVCWALVLVTLLVRGVETRWSYAALLCLLFFTHMIPFLFGGLLLVLQAVHTRRGRLLWQTVPALLLTVWYAMGRFFLSGNADSAVELRHIRLLSPAFLMYKVGSFLKSFGLVNPMNDAGIPVGEQTLGASLYLVFFGCAVLLCGLLLVLFARTLFAREVAYSPERLVKQAALVFLAVAVVAPSDLLGIADPGARLLQVALYVLVFPAAGRAYKLLLAATAGVVSLFSLVLFAKLVFGPEVKAQGTHKVSLAMQHLAFVEYRLHIAHTRALETGEMRLKVFPTAMFLNVPGQSLDPIAKPETRSTSASFPQP